MGHAMKKKPATPAIPAAKSGGKIDIEPIIAKINVPENLKGTFDKMVLSGMRIMFDKASHQLLLDQINGPEPMVKKLSDGIITLMYMLWTQSNKTLPPQLMVPVTVVLTLKAFDFLQQSGDKEATKEVLGETMHLATTGILDRFGAKPSDLTAMQQKVMASKQGGGMIQGGQNG